MFSIRYITVENLLKARRTGLKEKLESLNENQIQVFEIPEIQEQKTIAEIKTIKEATKQGL